MTAPDGFFEARDLLLDLRDDHDAAVERFRWPTVDASFNWALDVFDRIAAGPRADQVALWVVGDSGPDVQVTFRELAARSDQVAVWLRDRGVGRGDRVLLMLPNVAPLWEVILACIKLGAVLVPTSTLLPEPDLVDRVERGGIDHVVADASLADRFEGVPGDHTRIAVGAAVDGWLAYDDSRSAPAELVVEGVTAPDDPLLVYFTSGTTSKPKLVAHTHVSYPIGHLSTMYWIGLQPGDVHVNISSPGWAKHAWSCVFAPWNAEACVVVLDRDRFDARATLDDLARTGATTLCAPPTVWRLLIQQPLAEWTTSLRELVSAGEPLNPEVIDQVRAAWGLTIRDGFGQSETTALVGNSPGVAVRERSMGKPLPGYAVALLDGQGEPADLGEICIDLAGTPVGVTVGYLGDEDRTAASRRGGYFHTGDIASRDGDGYITYIGRDDDVFKSSDYRISPFELESVLIEHDAVAEAAVVPSPDEVKLAVPKAFVTLVPGVEPTEEVAAAILGHARERLAPFKRVQRLEFLDLPKTISGKIRRVELRQAEAGRGAAGPPGEWTAAALLGPASPTGAPAGGAGR